MMEAAGRVVREQLAGGRRARKRQLFSTDEGHEERSAEAGLVWAEQDGRAWAGWGGGLSACIRLGPGTSRPGQTTCGRTDREAELIDTCERPTQPSSASIDSVPTTRAGVECCQDRGSDPAGPKPQKLLTILLENSLLPNPPRLVEAYPVDLHDPPHLEQALLVQALPGVGPFLEVGSQVKVPGRESYSTELQSQPGPVVC